MTDKYSCRACAEPGICIDCDGDGKDNHGDVCLTCWGSGKCPSCEPLDNEDDIYCNSITSPLPEYAQ
jgi:hypothetical protein